MKVMVAMTAIISTGMFTRKMLVKVRTLMVRFSFCDQWFIRSRFFNAAEFPPTRSHAGFLRARPSGLEDHDRLCNAVVVRCVLQHRESRLDGERLCKAMLRSPSSNLATLPGRLFLATSSFWMLALQNSNPMGVVSARRSPVILTVRQRRPLLSSRDQNCK